MSHYLVTGGLGVIGSYYAHLKLSAGHKVTIIDAAEEQRNLLVSRTLSTTYHSNVNTVTQRLETGLNCDISSFDYIVHAAAHTGIPHSVVDPNDDWKSNVDATRVLLEALRLQKLQIPTVLLSSVKPYRTDSEFVIEDAARYKWQFNRITGFDETTELRPDEPYAASKMAQSALGMTYARSYGLPVTVLRCSNLYGPGSCHGPRHGWLTWFCISAALGIPIQLQGNGKQVRDMLYASDIASAIDVALDKVRPHEEYVYGLAGNVYNVGGGRDNALSCLESIEMIKKLAHDPIEVINAPGRENEDKIFITNFYRFKTATGWEPKVSVQQGIEQVYQWAYDNRVKLRDTYKDVK